MQHNKKGILSARANRDMRSCSVSPTLDRFSSELESGSTLNSIPAFLQIISHSFVFPVPGGPHLKFLYYKRRRKKLFCKLTNIIP